MIYTIWRTYLKESLYPLPLYSCWATNTFDLVLSSLIIIFIYPFVFVTSKIISNKGDFVKLILKIPRVLSGKNSFVGPMQKSENSELFLGKLGITGLWYLENIGKNDSAENRRLDLFYAKNQNIWLDLEIIGKTIAKTLSRRGKNG